MQNESCDNSDQAETSELEKDRAVSRFFQEAKKLNSLTKKLFAGTPYQQSLWPELWQYMSNRLKPHISAESYDLLIQTEVDMFKNKTAPVRFREKLAAFDQAFDAEIPHMLKVIEDVRAVLIVPRRNKAYKPSDVVTHFSGLIINRPRELPFPDYEFGVGMSEDEIDPGRKVCKNGRPTKRVHYMTTELVLMLSLLMGLPRGEIFMALFPYKMKNTLVEEWESLKPVIHTYYNNLNHYASMEVIYDDLLTLFGCYEVYITQGSIRTDSEKILVFLTSVCKQALKTIRFANVVERYADTKNPEGRLQVVFNMMFPKTMRKYAQLHRRVEESMEALRGARFDHIKECISMHQPNHHVLYPTFA